MIFNCSAMVALKKVAILTVMISFFTGVVCAQIEISSVEDLVKIGNDEAFPEDGNYVLTQNIDVYKPPLEAPYQGFPIVYFNGTFDGKGHVIRGFYTNESWTGDSPDQLFDTIGGDGEVRNLGIVDLSINIYHKNAGGLAGTNEGYITNCYSTGVIVSTGGTSFMFQTGTGGLVGENWGQITDCYSDCSITSGEDSDIGGIAGYNSGTITKCYFTGTISGEDDIGGIVGKNTNIVSLCHNHGIIVGDHTIGGIVGYNHYTDAYISQSYSVGEVSGNSTIGGLVGFNLAGKVENSYSLSTISANGGSIGGLVGYNEDINRGDDPGILNNCFYAGLMVSTSTSVGGVVGGNENSIVTACFWDMDVSEQYTSDGGEAKSTTAMMKGSTFTEAGWDFDTFWEIDEGRSYPYLRILGPHNGMSWEGEAISDDESGLSGCGSKEHTTDPNQLGDWLLVGLSLIVLMAFTRATSRT